MPTGQVDNMDHQTLAPRHIQNFSEAESLQHHWGYASRAVPCTNDPGSCEYLDTVYHSHDLGMLYTFIMWAAIGGILFIWGIGRRFVPVRKSSPARPGSDQTLPAQPAWYRLCRSLAATARGRLLPDAARPVFGRVSRLQVMVLLIISGYLAVFTFVGIVYRTWVTPVKNSPGIYNTRTGLGPWSDRIGVLAYALIPLSVLLSSRESLLSLITGVPYQHFNFLHRWLGYIIYIQSTMHTLGWVIVEGKLYQPQPSVWNEFIAQTYMIWGVVAMIFMSFLFFFSLPCAIKWTGYEFFRKAHYLVAMLFIGACWGHWAKLSCWLIASLVVWLVDRAIRLVRTGLLHYGYVDDGISKMVFQMPRASVKVFSDDHHGDVVRLDFEHNHQTWEVGQHFYLCFPECSLWQSHPFTPAGLSQSGNTSQPHTYIMRAKSGETKKLADMVIAKGGAASSEKHNAPLISTPVILAGPYGRSTVSQLHEGRDINVLCVAGGSGITFVLPVLQFLSRQTPVRPERKIELIWAVRKKADLMWVQQELDTLRAVSHGLDLTIRIFVTRENESAAMDKPSPAAPYNECKEARPTVDVDRISFSSDSGKSAGTPRVGTSPASFSVKQAPHAAITDSGARHPDLKALVKGFVSSTVRGPTCVYASGPGSMISDLRTAATSCNDGMRVWRGDEKFDVTLINDDRLEW